MKKIIAPALIAAIVFFASELFQSYSLILQENFGLFLTTPDFMKALLGRPLPVSRFISCFLIQLFRFRYAGPAVMALLAVLVYLAGKPVHSIAGGLCAAIAWYLSVKFQTPLPLVAAALILSLLSLVLCTLRKRVSIFKELKEKRLRWWSIVLPVTATAVTAAFAAFDPGIQKDEQWNRLLWSARTHDWDSVLSIATPGRCAEDREMIPFALLALSENSRIGEKMFSYPVTGGEDFDFEERHSRKGYYFAYILYELAGSRNEAIHNVFQTSADLEWGTSFWALRELTRLYAANGNAALAGKYADILSHSSFHKKWNGIAISPASGQQTEDPAPFITHSFTHNMGLLMDRGQISRANADRMLSSLLAERDLKSFVNIAGALRGYWPDGKLPRHYQEALLATGAVPEGIVLDEEVRKKYYDFLSGRDSADGSFWAYYYSAEVMP